MVISLHSVPDLSIILQSLYKPTDRTAERFKIEQQKGLRADE